MGCGCKKKKPQGTDSKEKDKKIREAMRSYMEFKKKQTNRTKRKSGK
jgi:hypothetical protein